MRFIRAFFPLLISVSVIVLLHRPLGSLPALGKLFDPVNGWAASAEPVTRDFSRQSAIKGLKQPVIIWLEDRMVPHVRAENEYDLYFAQGYLHAFFRLWQMEFQTHAAAGRIGEIVGERWVTDPRTKQLKNAVLEFDRGQRRKGMVFAAERSLEVMEAEPRTRMMLDAYTDGVNGYIAALGFRDFPVEYKLMNYAPEPWNNLKTALLLKSMADDLTGYTDDFPLSILKEHLPPGELAFLFPQRLKESIPVIPQGTKFVPPSMPVPEVPGGDIWSQLTPLPVSVHYPLPDENEAMGIGSNSWAVSGTRTMAGAPVLCNDPHLALNLPALWFEMQLQSPSMNVYGVSLPGAPGIIIGFNDSVSWGFTNNYRDVKDFYEIEKLDADTYLFDGRPKPFDKRTEIIKIKGKPDFVDTVYYTVHGPVIYDKTFTDNYYTGKMFALQWMAHRGTNELLAIHLLNKANEYTDFTDAIMHFQCPAQNMVYADRTGNIAMWGQGQFVNKWKDQGRYVMKGNTSATLWGEDIPMQENPHVLNPAQGYLMSANQVTSDSTYPYWYNGYFHDFRAWRINELLAADTFDIGKSFRMQNDIVSILAREIATLNYKDITRTDTSLQNNDADVIIRDAGLYADNRSATDFYFFWESLYKELWRGRIPGDVLLPSQERTMQLLINAEFFRGDEIALAVKNAYKTAGDTLRKLYEQLGTLDWYRIKGTQLTHLAKLDAFSYKNLKTGGWGNTINAVKKTHGPSWRMIVEMGRDSISAYGVYPGGQSGNPGSRHYGDFIHHWEKGSYYNLVFLSGQTDQNRGNIRYTWKIRPE